MNVKEVAKKLLLPVFFVVGLLALLFSGGILSRRKRDAQRVGSDLSRARDNIGKSLRGLDDIEDGLDRTQRESDLIKAESGRIREITDSIESRVQDSQDKLERLRSLTQRGREILQSLYGGDGERFEESENLEYRPDSSGLCHCSSCNDCPDSKLKEE